MRIIKWTAKKEVCSQTLCQAGAYLLSSLWEVRVARPLSQTLSLALLVFASVWRHQFSQPTACAPCADSMAVARRIHVLQKPEGRNGCL